jgi:hypothetical protein
MKCNKAIQKGTVEKSGELSKKVTFDLIVRSSYSDSRNALPTNVLYCLSSANHQSQYRSLESAVHVPGTGRTRYSAHWIYTNPPR